jgi:signal transduction histidine kinase
MRSVGTWCVTATDTDDNVIAGQQCSITVVAADAVTPAKLAIITSPQTISADGASDAITVQAQGSDDTPAPVFVDTKVYIETDSLTGEFSANGSTGWTSSAPFEVTIPAGVSSVNVFYRDTIAGTPTLTFKDTDNEGTPSDLADTSQQETIVAGAPVAFSIGGSGSITAGTFSPYSVTLQDAHGNTATATSETDVYVTSDSADMKFSASSTGSSPSTSYHTTIPDGETGIVVYGGSTAAGDVVITSSDAAIANGTSGLNDATLDVSVVSDAAITIEGLPTADMTVYTERQLNFEFHDIYGNVAPTSGGNVITYDSTSSKGQFTTSTPGWNNAPASFSVPSGSSVVSIQHQDGNVGTPTVTASMPGFTSGTIDLNVLPGGVHHFEFVPSNQTIIAGEAGAMIIKAYDQYDNETSSPTDLTLNLASSSGAGEFSMAASPWGAITSLTLPANSNSATVYYKDTVAGKPHITATNTASPFQAGADNPEITGADPVELYISSDPQVLAVNTPSRPITVGLKDQYGNPTRATADFGVSLSTPSPSGEFSADGSTAWSTSKTVTFADNTLAATIYYRDSVTGFKTIEASSDDYGSDSQQIQLEPGVVGKLVLLSDETDVVAGQIYMVNLETQTSTGTRAAVQDNTDIELSGLGEYSLSQSPWTPVDSVTVAEGQAGKQLYYKPTLAGTDTLTAAETPSQGWVAAELQLNVSGGAAYRFAFTTVPTNTQALSPSDPITLSAQDVYGNITTVEDDTAVYLWTSQTQGTFATSASGPWTAESITIPAGNSSQDFYYKTIKAGTANLTASDHTPLDEPDTDIVNGTASLPVSAGAAAKLVFKTLPQAIQIGQSSQQMRISLQDGGDNDVTSNSDRTINLSSSCATGTFSLAPGGPGTTQITMPSGSGDIFFYYSANELGNCNVTTSSSGLASAAQTETITAQAPVPVNISIDTPPQTLVAGQTSSAITVSLKDADGNVVAANTDITVSLASNSGNATFTPGSLVFHAGDSIASFTYRDLTAGTPTITASTPGLTDATQTETITTGTLSKLRIAGQNVVTAGQDATYTVELTNQYDAPFMASSDQTVYLHTTGDGTISDSGSNISQLTIPTGQSSRTFDYNQTSAGGVTLTASDVSTPPESPDTGLQNGTKSITVAPGSYYRLHFIGGPASIEAGEQSANFTVQAEDQYGNAVTLGAESPFPLSSTSGTGQFTGTHQQAYPGQLVIEAGASAGTFTYTDTTIGTPTLTADGQSGLDAVQPINVVAGTPTKLAFINPPAHFDRGGVSGPVAVSLENSHGTVIAANGDQTVYLSTTSATGHFATSTSGPWNVTQVTILDGATAATVYYRDDSVSPPATLTASDVSTPPEDPDTGLANATTVIANDATDPAAFVLSPATQTAIANHPSAPITVSTIDYHGNPTVPLTDQRVYLRSTSGNGDFSQDGVAWGLNYVTIPAGATNTTFYYRDKTDGTPTITASDAIPSMPDTGILNASQQLTIQRQVMSGFRVTNISDPQNAGNPSSVVVSAIDPDGYVIEWYAGRISFSSDDPTAILPAPYTFAPATDKGIHTFVNAVAFRRSGEKTVTVTDAAGKTGAQHNITVNGNYDGDDPTTPGQPGGEEPGDGGPGGNGPGDGTDTSGGSPAGGSTNGNNTGGSASGPSNRKGNQPQSKVKKGVLGAIGDTATTAARSKSAPVVVPAVLYSGVMFVAVLFLKQIYNEVRRIHRLLAALRREHRLSLDKTDFLRLAAHFLRTPITGIKGAAEVIKAQPAAAAIGERLSNLASSLHRETEMVIEQTETDKELQDIQEPNITQTELKAFVSPFFWMPVVLSIVLTLLANRLLQALGNEHITGSTVLLQLSAGIAAAVVLYFVLRSHGRKQQEAAALEHMLAERVELDDAKNRFIQNAYEVLSADTRRLADQENYLDDGQPMAKILKDSTGQLETLLEKFRQVATIKSVELYPAEFTPQQLATEALVTAEPKVQEKKIQVIANLDDEPIRQDEASLAQVLSSVFDNAVEFSPEGGTVELSSERGDNGLTIIVRDHGSGLNMDPEELFQAFKRGDDSLDFTHNGAGLSLFLDRIIMEHIGGTMSLRTMPDGGTEARIIVSDLSPEATELYHPATA